MSLFEDGTYARTNGAGLAALGGKMVSVVGRVGAGDTIEASDGVAVTLSGAPGVGEVPTSGCLEVVGTVGDDGSLSPARVTPLGDDFDLANYEALVELANGKYASLFSSAAE
mmetsp:Transcript_13400/g.39878  ORF Transcript_13400/g.39878 Transcript_13400/m.39878 type:complete len:112 (-) Transcript_13400:81-416(-)